MAGYEQDHQTSLLDSVLFRLRWKPRLRALLKAMASQIQLVEDEAENLVVSLDLDGASGDMLDTLGNLVGEPRSGRADSKYRRGIRARISANRSDGTRADVISTVELGMPSGDDSVSYSELYPATLRLVVQPAVGVVLDDDDRERLKRLTLQAKPAGVSVILLEENASPFRLRATGQTLDGPGLANLIIT